MQISARVYRPPRPETTALYEVVRENLETLYGAIDEWDGHEVLVFDVIALGATVGVAFTALRSTAQVTKRLYEMERLD